MNYVHVKYLSWDMHCGSQLPTVSKKGTARKKRRKPSKMTFHAKVLNWKLVPLVPGKNYTNLATRKVRWCYWCPWENTPLQYGTLSFGAGCSLLTDSIVAILKQYRKSIRKNYQNISQSCGTYHWDPRESLASQLMTCDPSVLREIASCYHGTRNRWPQFGDMSWILHLDIITYKLS